MAVLDADMPPRDGRPDPDALLEKLQQDEQAAQRGKLRIYFGSNAGVGKTCAMLTAARNEVPRAAMWWPGWWKPMAGGKPPSCCKGCKCWSATA